MKNLLVFAMGLGLYATQSANAGYMGTTCEAYRVSQDSNENIQVLKLMNETLELNKEKFELIDGVMRDLVPNYPSEAVFKSAAGKANLNLKVSVLSKVTEAYGRLSVGRGHDMIVYKVNVQASRNGKVHNFEGTCVSEVVTTCGGECAVESEDRDEI